MPYPSICPKRFKHGSKGKKEIVKKNGMEQF